MRGRAICARRPVIDSHDRRIVGRRGLRRARSMHGDATDPSLANTPPLVLAPASLVGVQDKRGRFREIYCAVLEAHGHALPDYRPCQDALTRVGTEPAGAGRPVDLGRSKRRLVAAVVPGIGYECFEPWLNPPGTVGQHVRQFGSARSC